DLAGSHRLYQGIFQMTIVRPAGVGAGPAHDMAAALSAQFPLNARYTSGSVTVQSSRRCPPAPPCRPTTTTKSQRGLATAATRFKPQPARRETPVRLGTHSVCAQAGQRLS